MRTLTEKHFGPRVSYRGEVDKEVTGNMTPELKDQIVKAVKDWLSLENKDDGNYATREFYLKDANNKLISRLTFRRYEVQVPTCANQWMVWRVASAFGWPELISVPVMLLGVNDYALSDTKEQPPINTLHDDYERAIESCVS